MTHFLVIEKIRRLEIKKPREEWRLTTYECGPRGPVRGKCSVIEEGVTYEIARKHFEDLKHG